MMLGLALASLARPSLDSLPQSLQSRMVILLVAWHQNILLLRA